MIENLITLLALMVMVFTHVWMAIIVRDGVRAKGLEALFYLCCLPFALLYYSRLPKRQRKGVEYLNWVFLASTAVVIFKVS